ncbi:succinate-semialdehyde dehydrogenase [Kineosporia sp. NBRC 101677]|uniref:aldehyde dehydrogenase family protein n=1 Tax=Kineosporia sp. NBRC 101677 TaxID=3032197 RepID=UPI0024A41DEF|nr:aldehyde dehydrogenase family protein [Kineosporia sp. NBRC 101677]GLY17101.1 succinate-semialdehyde dehydrogenase [Kineosporia sp. NBRC 101677]
MSITTIDPTTGAPLHTYPTHGPDEIEALVARGAAAAAAWGRVPLEQRVQLVQQLAEELRGHRDDLAGLIVAEMGKPLAEAGGEVEKSALTAEYYADNASAILARRTVEVGPARAWITQEPLGLLLAVMPWNFPLWQVMRFAVPAVAAGNGVLLKHSPNVTGSALALQDLFEQTGFPAGLLTTLVVAEPQVPATIESLIADDRVAAVTLTGSNRAGAAVGAAAGRAAKKSVLELGGSDAFVVLEDADVEAAAAAAVKARFTNGGQSCVCAKRFIIAAAVAEDFVARFVAGVQKLSVGDPAEPGTDMGPMARDDLREALARQVEQSVAAGARVLTGGQAVEGEGFFFAPTVLADVKPGMAAFDEETFGPVAALTIAENDDEAVTLANATQFGLGLSIWTRDEQRGVAVAERITSGAVFINAVVASDPRVPFGGTKKSGYGRELAADGMLEFTSTRTYWVGPA